MTNYNLYKAAYSQNSVLPTQIKHTLSIGFICKFYNDNIGGATFHPQVLDRNANAVISLFFPSYQRWTRCCSVHNFIWFLSVYDIDLIIWEKLHVKTNT